MRQASPSHFDVGDVEGSLFVQLTKLPRDRLRTTNDEVDRVGTKILRTVRFRGLGRDFSLVLKSPPQNAKGRLSLAGRRFHRRGRQRPAGLPPEVLCPLLFGKRRCIRDIVLGFEGERTAR